MTWIYVLRINVLLGLCVALARCQNEQAQQTPSSAVSSSTEAPKITGDEGGLTSDQRAALWAGFVGGMVCIFGLGMLFYDMVVRKYSQQYHYARRVDMHVETYKP